MCLYFCVSVLTSVILHKVYKVSTIPADLKKTLVCMHMLICGLYSNSNGHLEKAVILNLKINLWNNQKYMFASSGPSSSLLHTNLTMY